MANEAFGVSGVGGLQDTNPLDVNAVGATEMDRCRCVDRVPGLM